MTDTDARLIERLRGSAKAFRENPVYDSEGDGVHLVIQADEFDEAATRIESLTAALKQCRTNICGYNLHDSDDAFETVAKFYKEICRVDAIARAALGDSK